MHAWLRQSACIPLPVGRSRLTTVTWRHNHHALPLVPRACSSVETGGNLEGAREARRPLDHAHHPIPCARPPSSHQRMAAPAIPVPVPGESGDTEQRAAYADTADPTAATPPSVSREPSLAEAAAALTQQTVCPALTPAAPIPVAGRSDYTEQRAAYASADGPIAIAPLSGEREPSLAGEAAAAPTRHTISPALTPANKEVWEPSSVGGNRRTQGREAPTGRVATGCRALNQQSALIPPSRRSCRAASHRPWPS